MDIYFAIPVLDENDYLTKTLDCIAEQSYQGQIYVYLCVNQPDSWWNDSNTVLYCKRNQELLHHLSNGYRNLCLHVIDRTTKGKGWDKKSGVGIARKTIADEILNHASDEDILISMDADTIFDSHFVEIIVADFQSYTRMAALNLPYYHSLSGNELQDRALLRYELYLRNYMLNMLRIDSPYAYTAFGSAIACRIKDYKSVGGFDTQTAGEDFYFLQKIVKYGKLKLFSEAKVFPSSRFSTRVPFGTGPAIFDFQNNSFVRYPIFHYFSFDSIEETYKSIADIFYGDIDTSFIAFLKSHYRQEYIWDKLRKNYKTIPMFKKAFHHKVDGLRLFQYVRVAQKKISKNDETCLLDFLHEFHSQQMGVLSDAVNGLSFQTTPVSSLDRIRDFLALQEDKMRKQKDIRNFT